MANEASKTLKKPLGQRLIESGLINEAQLNLALNESKSKGIYLGQALEGLDILAQEVITQFLADESGSEIIDVKNYPIDPEVIKLVPYELARRYHILPLSRSKSTIKAVVADTLDILAVDALELETGLTVEVVTAPKNDIFEAIEHHYAQQDTFDQIIKEILSKGVEHLEEESGDVLPVIRLVDLVISKAIKSRSTDIHFEPDEKVLRVRLRIDGNLRQEVLIPKELQSVIITRLKIMGGLDITESRLPMDGRISFHTGVRDVDLRLSTLPTSNGEVAVMRILDKESVGLDFVSLEFSKRDRDVLEKVLKSPNGLILVTGPTGSGKTSTLYASLGVVSTMERNVLTLEDPIEYELPLIRQTPINAEVGMDFPMGLRAMLRQDPDVIMVGEIRDAETASLAIRAALTGHLVFSTLHTNSAAGAVPRLVDMGVKSYLVASSLKTIIAQRLVRRICAKCKVEIHLTDDEIRSIGVRSSILSGKQMFKGAGCNVCGNSGYRSRLGIFEIMAIDSSYHDLIVNNAGAKELEQHAKSKGMRKLIEDGFGKVLKGFTTLEEVVKVVYE